MVRNKCDISGEPASITHDSDTTTIHLSAANKDGVELLANHLKSSMGYETSNEGQIIARRRHLDALKAAYEHINDGQYQLETSELANYWRKNCALLKAI